MEITPGDPQFIVELIQENAVSGAYFVRCTTKMVADTNADQWYDKPS